MNIYISHSPNSDFTNELYKPLQDSPLSKEHTFIFPHADSDSPFNTRDLFETHGCDLVIAEVTNAATGQGIELGWASLLNIPIVCIYKEGAELSSSLSLVSNKFLMYTSTENMIDDITRVLQTYA